MRFLTREELGCWLSQQRKHHLTALSQEEISDEIRCYQLKQTTSCWLVGHGHDEKLAFIHSKSGSNLMLRQKSSIIEILFKNPADQVCPFMEVGRLA